MEPFTELPAHPLKPEGVKFCHQPEGANGPAEWWYVLEYPSTFYRLNPEEPSTWQSRDGANPTPWTYISWDALPDGLLAYVMELVVEAATPAPAFQELPYHPCHVEGVNQYHAPEGSTSPAAWWFKFRPFHLSTGDPANLYRRNPEHPDLWQFATLPEDGAKPTEWLPATSDHLPKGLETYATYLVDEYNQAGALVMRLVGDSWDHFRGAVSDQVAAVKAATADLVSHGTSTRRKLLDAVFKATGWLPGDRVVGNFLSDEYDPYEVAGLFAGVGLEVQRFGKPAPFLVFLVNRKDRDQPHAEDGGEYVTRRMDLYELVSGHVAVPLAPRPATLPLVVE